MADGLEKAMLYGFRDEISGLLETSSAGTSEDLDKSLHKAEVAEAILQQTKEEKPSE